MIKNGHWKLILVVIALSVLAGAAWLWVYTKTAQVRDEIYATRSGLAEIEVRVENIKHLENMLEEAEAERAAVEGAFTDSRGIVHFIEKMEELATTTQVTLEVRSAALPVTGGEFGPVFHAEVSGDFGAVYKFISLLMDTDYQVLPDKFFLEQKEDREKKIEYWLASLDFRMISYINK